MKKIFFALFMMFSFAMQGTSLAPKREFYEIKIYKYSTPEQEVTIDQYLAKAFLPALHRTGIKKIGVFKWLGNDTASVKMIYVFIPFVTLDQYVKLPSLLEKDQKYGQDGKAYIDAAYNEKPYDRIESIFMQAFSLSPTFNAPALKAPYAERIYELRSYEGPTEKLYRNKVKMFNDGDEIDIFSRLKFNAVFYAEVISGPRMPNLMYMTTFDNMESRDEHWDAFRNDAAWKKLSAMPEYQHNVSKADIIFLRPASYSDL